MPIKVQCSDCLHSLSAPDDFAGRTVKCPVCNAPISVKSAPPPLDATDDSVREARSVRTTVASAPGRPKKAAPISRFPLFDFKLVIAVVIVAIGLLILNSQSIHAPELTVSAILALLLAAGTLKSQITHDERNGWFTVETFLGRFAAGAMALGTVTKITVITIASMSRYHHKSDGTELLRLGGGWFGFFLGMALIWWMLQMYEEHGFFKVASWTFLVTNVFLPLFIALILAAMGKDPYAYYVALHTPDDRDNLEVFNDQRPAAKRGSEEPRDNVVEPVNRIAPDEVAVAFSRKSSESLEKMVSGMQAIVDQRSLHVHRTEVWKAGADYVAKRKQAKAVINALPEQRKQATIESETREHQPARDAILKRAEQEALRLQTSTSLWPEVQKALPKELLERSAVLSANPPAPDPAIVEAAESPPDNVAEPEPAKVVVKPLRPVVEPPAPRTFSTSELEFAREARSAFRSGQFVQGVDYWRAELIAIGGEKLAKEFRWCAGLRRPTLGLVWGFGGGVTSEFEAAPFDSDDQNVIAQQLTFHTGDTGEFFVEAIERRVKQRLYGRYIDLVEEQPNRLEGVLLIPVGIQADVLSAARRQHCDVVVIGEVQPVAGTSDKAIMLRLFDPNADKPLWESESLRAAKIVRERKKGNDPVKDLVASAVKFVEERLELKDLPPLKSDVVERRAERLAAAESVTLNSVAELVYYHDAKLLATEKYEKCVTTTFGPEISKLLASDNEHQRRAALAMILEKAKVAKGITP